MQLRAQIAVALLATAAVVFVWLAYSEPVSYPGVTPSIGPSEYKASFDFSTYRTEAPGSDNWPATWSDDGHHYAFWGDGGGFGGTNSAGRVSWGAARVEGSYDNYTGFNVNGGKNPENPSTGIDGKSHQQPISRNGVLYAWITPGSGATGFLESRLYRSTDKGATWTDAGVVFSNDSHGVSHIGFVQYGQDYSDGPGYFYLTSTEVQQNSDLLGIQAPGNIFMLRVPVDEVENQASYQWFTRAPGLPSWGNLHDRAPIYSESTGLGAFGQLQHVAGLNRFVFWLPWDGLNGEGPASSNLLILEAPDPWGPFAEVERITDWGAAAGIEDTVFQWQLAPKWIRNGGSDFTLIFSGTDSNDSWNTLNGRFTHR